jgi:dipeptidyl aminopeptidase/acylaminoacyl peptidase
MPNIDNLTTALADRYHIEREIGAGGMATVYLAEDRKHGRQVALKVLRSELASTMGPERFHREIAIAAKLQHPHIVPLHDSGEADGFLFYVMPYVEGESLRQRLDREGELPVGDAVRILRDVTDALAYAHQLGVVHRDIKPENIMLSGRHAMVTDFGVAKAVSEATGRNKLTTAGIALGTPSYMAPEQAAADPNVDHRADIYAVGAVGYELLAGRAPFVKNSPQEILAAHVTEAVEPVTKYRISVAAPLEELVMRALAKRPADRWQSANELADRLELLATPSGGMTPTATRPVSGWTEPPKRGSRLPLAIGAVAILALAVAAVVLAGRDPGTMTLGALPPDRQVTFTGDVVTVDLAPDGRTVAYTTSDMRRVMLADLDGGGTSEIFTAPAGISLARPAWSPDGSRLYISTAFAGDGIYSVPRLGGEAQLALDLRHLVAANGVLLQDVGRDGLVVLSLGAQWLYAGNDAGQLRVGADGPVGDDLFRPPGIEQLGIAQLSPDGQWLAYSGFDSLRRARTGVTSTDGASGPGILPAATGQLVSWSADGRGLYLATSREGGSGSADLNFLPVDPVSGEAAGQPTLVYPGLVEPATTSVSADGRRLVYGSGFANSNLKRIVLDDTPAWQDNTVAMLTRGTASWSADFYLFDGRVLGVRETPDGYDVVAIDGSGRQESLASRRGVVIGQCASVTPSPDGRYLALPEVRAGEGGGPVPVILEIATGRVEPLDVPEEPCELAWSPDGSRLAAMTMYRRDKILVIDRISGEGRLQQLQCDDRCEFAFEGMVMSPEWPYAAVTSEIDTWILNVDDGSLRHLQTGTWWVMGWIGDQVWFYRNASQRPDVRRGGVYRVPVAGGSEALVLDVPDDCGYLTVARDGSEVTCEALEVRRDIHVIDGFDPAREVK